MKIVLAPNAFKGSLTAREAAEAMAAGVARASAGADIVRVPVADGGDGLVDVAVEALHGELRTALVSGPLGRPVEAAFCFVAGMRFAAIEMALASGLALLAEADSDATLASTVGTGELIRAALDLGATRIGVGIGGSASNDGGTGAASALGVRFLDRDGRTVTPAGANLAAIHRIDMSARDPRIAAARVEAICDVSNVLCGPDGAAHVYGAQKGASPGQIEMLDAGLASLAEVIRRDVGLDVAAIPGAGAAGGLGAGLMAFLGADLRPGAELVLELVGFEDSLPGADLVITGEGRIDRQTLFGKAPAAVVAAAGRHGVPCVVVAGSIADDLGDPAEAGIADLYAIAGPSVSIEESMRNAAPLLGAATEKAVRRFIAREGRYRPG